jgi:ESF2/ABP1 family protein
VERKKRLRAGGSKKTMFKDGWIEFESKKVAKFVGNHLNNTPVGGPKRHNFWREDIWNLRYLSKFKWHHLLEYHTGKKKAREVSRALELQQMRRENTHYLEQVEKKRKKDMIALDRLTKKKKKEVNCS